MPFRSQGYSCRQVSTSSHIPSSRISVPGQLRGLTLPRRHRSSRIGVVGTKSCRDDFLLISKGINPGPNVLDILQEFEWRRRGGIAPP